MNASRRASAPAASSSSSRKASSDLRRAAQRAQHVERHDVARALPDRRQRHLAIQARHAGLLDVAVAAEALERLERVARPALADPVLADRGREALELARAASSPGAPPRRRRARRRIASAVAASDSMHRSASTLRMSGWSARRRPNALRWAACQVALATPQRMPAAVPMTQSSRVWPTISMIVGTPRPRLADELRPRAVQLDLARRVGAVAELVLQALEVHRVARAVGQDPRQREARQALVGVCARTRKRSHIGAEQNHLWPVSVVLARPARRRRPARATVVFARTSEPPCFSVIAIPHSALRLAGRAARGRTSSPSAAAPSAAAISGCARSAGTAANVIVIGQAKPPSACAAVRYSAVRAACAAGCADVHGRRVQLVAHRERHEVVPRAVKLDLVDAVAVAVEGLQPRRVLVGLEAPADRLGAPRRADLAARARAPSRRPRARAPRRARGCRRTGCGSSSGGTWLATSWV